MVWKRKRTDTSVDVEVSLDEFDETQLLQALIDAKWIDEKEAEAIEKRASRTAVDSGKSIFSANVADAEELSEARDNLRRGRKAEALIHLERFLGREWSGMLH